MELVEESQALSAKRYTRPLTYTIKKPTSDGLGPFHYVFDHGELDCTHPPTEENRVCYVARGAETTLAKEDPSFVYLDVGCWVDDADGNGTRHRDFGLVCGPHVYLCEYVGRPVEPSSRVPAVRDFFHGMADLGCGARVVGYARAKDFDRKTWQDPDLYLLLGDLHLPPVTWFYWPMDRFSPPEKPLPQWLARAPAMARQKSYLLHSYYNAASYNPSTRPKALYTRNDGQNPDIFGNAGLDAARFLRGLASLDSGVREKLHFIHLGDMFELWIGRDYHLVPGPGGTPSWRYPDSAEIVANWCLEVMVHSAPIFTGLERLERAGLAEVKYLGGNHDGYLMQQSLVSELGIPQREPFYLGLHGDLMVEHGHRFDGSNHDNVDGRKLLSGPAITEQLLLFPWLRKLEGVVDMLRIFVGPRQRETHMLGASLIHLYQRYQLRQKPFSIYAMGHTHEPMLAHFHVRAIPTITAHEPMGTLEELP